MGGIFFLLCEGFWLDPRTDSHLNSCKILQLFTQLVLGFHSTVISPDYYLSQPGLRLAPDFLNDTSIQKPDKRCCGRFGDPM